MMSRLFAFCAVLFFATTVSAQDFSFGFKTGLNFNNIKGELEETADATETLDNNIGFHFGATFAWNITDLMGLRGEFMYSQKGTNRGFEGPSYYNFTTADNEIIRTTGLRKQDLNLNNAYIEVPIMAYFKPFSRFEVFGGASVGLLVNSSAFGNLKMTGIKDEAGIAVGDINHELDFNYLADKAGEYTLGNPASTVKINGDNVPYPQTAGAYFEFLEDRGKLYKAFDLGLVGGVSVYLSKSLYLSGRINYGLMDITKSKADVSLSGLDNGEFISRDDDDRNVSMQVSIGFSF
jgi:Outer membrane protein beta-barrel domain